MFLVVGLGNPGSGYAHNRHNIGFMAADMLVRRHSFDSWRTRFQGNLSEGLLGGEKIYILKPATFMNLSGQAVATAARFYRIAPENVIILHDELDIVTGKLRIKRGGGAGGHNGIKSIDQHLGNATLRVRMGIGHPGHKDLVTPHVLGDFAKSDQQWLDPFLEAIADEFPLLIKGEDNQFMTRVAQITQPPKPKIEKPKTKDTENNGL